MSAIDLAKLNPGWQRRSDTVSAGVAIYCGVLRTPQGRIVYWRCEDSHVATDTARECARRKLGELLAPTGVSQYSETGQNIYSESSGMIDSDGKVRTHIDTSRAI